MNIAIFSEAPLWISHHAEAIELAIQNIKKSKKVHFISCKSNLLGCPANPKKNLLLCAACRAQTYYTNNKILKDKKYIKAYIDLDSSVKINFNISSIEELQNYKYEDAPIGNMVYSTIVTELNDSFFDTNIHKKRINDLMLNAIRIYKFTLLSLIHI